MIKHLLPILSILALSACASETTNNTETPAQASAPASEQPADKGTTVNVGSGGVSVDSDKGSVDLSKDSASIKLP